MTQPRKSRFGRGLGIYCLALAGAAALGLALLWLALARYERSTPEYSIQQYLKAVQEGDDKALLQASGFTPGRFSTQEGYLAAVHAALDGVPADRDSLAFVKGQADGGAQVYTLGVDGKAVAKLSLTGSAEEGWKVAPVLPEPAEYTLFAPAGAQVIVNGVPLTEADRTAAVPAEGFEDLAGSGKEPLVYQYSLPGLYTAPEVTARLEDGSPCQAEVDSAARTASVTLPAADEARAECEAFLETASKQYAQFISEDVSFSELATLLYPDTTFYKGLRGYYVGWYVTHSAVRFDDFTISNVVNLGGGAWQGDVSFTYVVTKPGLEDRAYPSAYHLSVLRTDSGWKLVNLEVG